MPLKSFKEIPKNVVEWGRYFQSLVITPDPGSVGADEIADGSVTFQKLQTVQPDRLLGRDTSPAGVVQELGVDAGLEFFGSGIRVADDGITNEKLRDSAGLSVIGRAASTAGNPADIPCSTADTFLVRRGSALTFDALADGDIPAGIARDAEVTAAIAALSLASGTYTPTVTNVANLDASTAYTTRYMRIGSIVLVSGRVDVDPTAAATTSLRLTLPIASNLTNTWDLSGSAYANEAAQGAALLGDATNDAALMQFIATDTANRAMWFNFTYQVL